MIVLCTFNPTVNSMNLLLTSDTSFLGHIINESCTSLFMEKSELCSAMNYKHLKLFSNCSI